MKTIIVLWNAETASLDYDCLELSQVNGETFEQAITRVGMYASLDISVHDQEEETETYLVATIYDNEEGTKLGILSADAKGWDFISFDESVCYSMEKKN